MAQRNIPPKAPPGFVNLATACLIARGMIYWKSTPGDCGSPTHVDFGSAQITGDIGNVAMGIASMAGAQLPGVGEAIGIIQGIFQHHAQAVANEQATICKVLGVMNQVFKRYDALVANGSISPSAAYAGMQNFIAQVDEQLGSIMKQCNSACVWQGVLAAHSDFVQTYYPAIAPRGFFSHAPGGAPSLLGTTPGGVLYTGGGLETGPLPSGGYGFTISASGLLLGLMALIIIFALAGGLT